MPRSQVIREGREVSRLTGEAPLNRAFRLAHSIFRYENTHREIALNIVLEALRGIEVRLTAQVEADRHDPQKPTKVRWNTAQWLQILVLCKSEKYETLQEAGQTTSLSQEDMIIRYLKHLILTTYRRNSFHVSLGLSRLVYGYSAAEAMAVYDLVFQDPDSSTRKADAYYRARKSKLMEELERRFHHFLRIEEGPRGEKRFQLEKESGKFSELVARYLKLFAPWDTNCELPKQIDAWIAMNALQASQASQIHALVHPACFARITEALKLATPQESLALPRFFLTGTSSSDESTPAGLTDKELREIRTTLKDDEKKRGKFTPRSLRVVVDGVEVGQLSLAHSNSVRVDLPANATLIEIVGRSSEGECLLATHVITYNQDESQSPEEYSILLGGGQTISLQIALDDRNDSSHFAEINYREAKVSRALLFWLRQITHPMLTAGAPKLGGLPLPVPAIPIILVALMGLVVILYMTFRGGSEERIAKVQPTPVRIESSTPPIQASPSPERGASETPKPVQSPDRPPTPPDMTRDQTGRAAKSVLDVRRVYVGSFGDDSFSQAVRQKLIEKLRTGYELAVTDTPDDADTAVAGSISSVVRQVTPVGESIEVGTVQLRLVNVSGEVIWRSRRYRRTATIVADQFAKDLRAAIEQEKRRQKKN